MTKEFLRNPIEDAKRQVAECGDWIVATVDPQMHWPKEHQIILYENKDFVLLPDSQIGDAHHTAGVAIRTDRYGLDNTSARREIMRFCSALAWSEGRGLTIMAWSSGELPRPLGIKRWRGVTPFLEIEPLPIAGTTEERAAIALYREGVSLDNPFYAFLSLYKAISVILPKRKERGEWIATALNRLDNNQAKDRYGELKRRCPAGIDNYLYEAGRCAIAHAEREPFVNPDEVDDHFRLTQDIPLVRNLAELAIEERTNLQRRQTIWSEHLYELSGFKALIPEPILDSITKSKVIPDGTTVDMPEWYTVVARNGPQCVSFQNMKGEFTGQLEGGLVFDLSTVDAAILIRTNLDFADEKLHFDPMRGIAFSSNRDDCKFLRYEIDLLLLTRYILSNGHIEIWDQDKGTMLGRSETCIPVNCFINDKYYESELSILNQLLESKDTN